MLTVTVKPRNLRLLIALLALPVLGFHVVLKQQPEPSEVAQLRSALVRPAEWRGRVAPDFDLTLLDGTHFKLSEHVGREVVVLNFFTTWCGPCKAEMPELSRFYAEKKGDPVVLLGIDGEEKRELVEAFLRTVAVAFPVGIDASGELLKSFGVDSYPTTVVIGADGRLQLYQSGAIMNADVALAAIIDASIGQIRLGQGVSKDAYLIALQGESYPRPRAPDGPTLNAHARQIASSMPCPCGCSDTLQACSCGTARKAKAKLGAMSLEGRDDAEVKTELNREFCMKGMQ